MATLTHRILLRLAQAVLLVPGRACFGFTAEGAARLPRRGGAIVCANHVSFLDPVVLQAPFRRPIHYLMLAEFYDDPRFRWAARAFEAIRVSEDADNTGAIEAAGEVLESGDVVGIFPEGGISRDGSLRDFRSGAAVLAMRHGVPLVPARLSGTLAALPRGARRLRFARISVRVGEPVAVERAGAAVLDAEAVAALTGRLRDAVASLARHA